MVDWQSMIHGFLFLVRAPLSKSEERIAGVGLRVEKQPLPHRAFAIPSRRREEHLRACARVLRVFATLQDLEGYLTFCPHNADGGLIWRFGAGESVNEIIKT